MRGHEKMPSHVLQLQGSMRFLPTDSAALSTPASLNPAFVQGSEAGLWSDLDLSS